LVLSLLEQRHDTMPVPRHTTSAGNENEGRHLLPRLALEPANHVRPREGQTERTRGVTAATGGHLQARGRPGRPAPGAGEEPRPGDTQVGRGPLAGRAADRLSCQLTAFFTSAAILASSAAVNSGRAKAVGHMAPSSRFALSPKPSVAYLL